MLYVELNGGIGNILFQIASAYGIAKNNDMQLTLITYKFAINNLKKYYKCFDLTDIGLDDDIYLNKKIPFIEVRRLILWLINKLKKTMKYLKTMIIQCT